LATLARRPWESDTPTPERPAQELVTDQLRCTRERRGPCTNIAIGYVDPVPDRPKHALADVVRLARIGGRRVLRESPSDWKATGLEYEEVFEVVAKLKPSDFYKSMKSEQLPGTWLDDRPRITTPAFPRGVDIYCKVTISEDGVVLFVLSFKEK
jgi:hypothetical protein